MGAWEIERRAPGRKRSLWRRKDAEGRTRWAWTVDRDGVAVEPTAEGATSKRFA